MNTFDSHNLSNPSNINCCRPLAGLLAARPFLEVGHGLAETNLSPAANLANKLRHALENAVNSTLIDQGLPPGCSLAVKEVERVYTHEVGAVVFLLKTSELIGEPEFDALGKAQHVRCQQLIRSALAVRGADPKQLDLGLDERKDRQIADLFAQAFDATFPVAAELECYDPASDDHLRLLHIGAVRAATPKASAGSLRTEVGSVVGFKANKSEIWFKLTGGGGTIQVEFRHDVFAAKLLLLYFAAQPCEMDIVVTNFQETGHSAAKTKYVLSQVNLALEHDWGPILDACIAAKEFLTRNSVAPAEWGSTNMTGAGNGRGASAHNPGSHGHRQEKPMSSLHAPQESSAGLQNRDGGPPALQSSKPRSRKQR